MQPGQTNHDTVDSKPGAPLLLLLGLALAAGLILAKNPLVFMLLATDGMLAVCVIAAAGLGGMAVLPAFRLGSLPLRQQLLFGAAIGLGLMATLVLLLGLAGITQRPVWIAILALFAAAGLVRLRRVSRRADDTARGSSSAHLRWLWLCVCPFLALTILVASVPPGYLWSEEGNGYDVLEYHLQMPKEYHQAGRIVYAPHNVYASFPANVEMLYLLCMILRGDPIEAAVACKLLNAGLAVLTVAAAWTIGRRRSAATGLVTAVIAAGTGWLTYLSGVAYVENGMLFFGLTATAAAGEALRDPTRRLRWCILAGVLAGFCLGCKYTAGILIGLPLAIVLLVCVRATGLRRLAAVAVCLLAQAVAFVPWAAKNSAMTGNPVFPLANRLFEAYPPGWGPAQSDHFEASHAPAPDQRGVGQRLASAWRHIPADPDQRFGLLLLVLAVWGAVASRRDPTVRLCSTMLLLQIPVWLFGTHLYARFAVPLLIPLVVLAGRVPLEGRNRRRAVVGLIVAGTLVNLAFSTRLYLRHMLPDNRRFDLEGVTAFFTQGAGLGHEHLEIINRDLPTGARVLMIGDAKAFYFRRPVDYCVVFNRSPFVEVLRSGADPTRTVNWLAQNGYTHVLVNWSEIKRLSSSRYGFPEEVTPDLFARLTAAGLHHTSRVASNSTGRPYADLYEVHPDR